MSAIDPDRALPPHVMPGDPEHEAYVQWLTGYAAQQEGLTVAQYIRGAVKYARAVNAIADHFSYTTRQRILSGSDGLTRDEIQKLAKIASLTAKLDMKFASPDAAMDWAISGIRAKHD